MRKMLLLAAMLTLVAVVAIPALAQGFDGFDDRFDDEWFGGFVGEGFFDRFDDAFDVGLLNLPAIRVGGTGISGGKREGGNREELRFCVSRVFLSVRHVPRQHRG
jgi:hypothetical protein